MKWFLCPSCSKPVHIDGASSEWVHSSIMDGLRCFWRRLRGEI